MSTKAGSTPTSSIAPLSAWRVPLFLSGIAAIVGGAMHPKSADSHAVAERTASMIVGHEGIWIVGHSLMTIGAALLLTGFLGARKANAWPGASRALSFAIPAAALSVVDLVLHTLDVLDGDELATGNIPLLTRVHLVVALVAGVVFGLAFAGLAWSLGRTWGGPRQFVAAIGIVAGLASAIAVPVVLIFGADILFPIGAVGGALWAIATGITGAPALERTVPVGVTTT
ncbi:MAG: hypothetical protein R2698_15005 [Microthrixaceae bacterium]